MLFDGKPIAMDPTRANQGFTLKDKNMMYAQNIIKKSLDQAEGLVGNLK
jgi:hypothetical protein